MGVTQNLKLPYPELTDVLDGPDAISDLASATEGYFYNRVPPSGVTRTPSYYWGSGTTFPTTGVLPGDTFKHMGLGGAMMVYTGASPAWKQLAAPLFVADPATRQTMSLNYSAQLYGGFEVGEVSTGLSWRWNGTQWELIGYHGTGSEKSTQMSLALIAGVPDHDTDTKVTWSGLVTQPTVSGLLALSSDKSAVVCQVRGRVRIEALLYSDAGVAGRSHTWLTFPGTSQGYLGTLEDLRQRTTGYSGSGSLRQPLSGGPFTVSPGDQISLFVHQLNTTAVKIPYDFYLNVTYV